MYELTEQDKKELDVVPRCTCKWDGMSYTKDHKCALHHDGIL